MKQTIKNRATALGTRAVRTALIFLCMGNAVLAGGSDPAPKAEWHATASGAETESCNAAKAIDGDRTTRWSSPWSDPQWLQVDLPHPAEICGLTIYWEHAFSTRYQVQVSRDGAAWQTVYQNDRGDGKVDDVNFKPVTASFIRIVGQKRSSSWGHSIWEVDLKGPTECIIITADAAEGCDNGDLCDGKVATVWTAATPTADIVIDLRKEKTYSGLRVDWGENYATDVEVSLSNDGVTWESVSELEQGTGQFDYLMWPPHGARYIRLQLKAAANDAPAALREITFLTADESLDEYGPYEIAAQKARPGVYPEWLVGRQTYWTITGLPNDQKESLLDEYGNLEPMKGSTCIMPYLYLDDQLITARDATVTQHLDDGYLPLPSVNWALPGMDLLIEAQTDGSLDDSVTYLQYTLRNTSSEAKSGQLFLVIRPLQINPKWQFGGLSRIHDMAFKAANGGLAVSLNEHDDYIALSMPRAYGAQSFCQGDCARAITQGQVPESRQVSDEDGLISGALAYAFDLAPGAETNVVVAAPLHENPRQVAAFLQGHENPHEAFDAARSRLQAYWRDLIHQVDISLPDQNVVNSFYSQLAYILINRDGPTIQPASRNYKRGWIRDGSMTSVALLRSGMTNEVREFLEWYAQFVDEDGLVHHIVNSDGTPSHLFTGENEWDSQGEYVHAIMEYYRYTKDRDFLARHFDEIVRALKYLEQLRARTLAEDYMSDEPGRERFVGILPKSISHEGYIPAMHSYWDDFWALTGWRDGAQAARILERKDVARWAEQQYILLEDALRTAIVAAIDYHALDYVPGSAEKGDFDPTSTAIAFYPCATQDLLPQEELRNTFDQFYRRLKKRDDPEWTGQFVPYEIRSVLAYVSLGQNDRAQDLLQFLLGCQRPLNWNHWVELYVSDERLGTYIGDMPHTWVGSGYVNTIRSMLVREGSDQLILLEGVPEEWLSEGDGIRIKDLPTHFGPLNMTARLTDGVLTVDIDSALDVPNGFEIHWPTTPPKSITVDGKALKSTGEDSCLVPSGAKLVVMQ